jgi:hypothetical protein
MSAQPENFPLPFDPHPASIQARFESFHRNNPAVLRAIIQIARDAKSRGYKTWSINGVFEILRWSRKYAPLRAQLQLTDGEGFALNNIFRSRYSRLVEEVAPDLKGFFLTRKLQSE